MPNDSYSVDDLAKRELRKAFQCGFEAGVDAQRELDYAKVRALINDAATELASRGCLLYDYPNVHAFRAALSAFEAKGAAK